LSASFLSCLCTEGQKPPAPQGGVHPSKESLSGKTTFEFSGRKFANQVFQQTQGQNIYIVTRTGHQFALRLWTESDNREWEPPKGISSSREFESKGRGHRPPTGSQVKVKRSETIRCRFSGLLLHASENSESRCPPQTTHPQTPTS